MTKCHALLLRSSVMEYMYRDASNFKAWGSVLLKGRATNAQISAIQSAMDSGVYFIAEQVGLPALQTELFKYSNGRTRDDHTWHEFVCIREAEEEDLRRLTLWGTVRELVSAFGRAEPWNPTLSVVLSKNEVDK